MRSWNSWRFVSSRIWTFKLMTEFWSNLTMSLTRRFSLQSKLQDSNKLFYFFPRIEIIFVCITAWFNRRPGRFWLMLEVWRFSWEKLKLCQLFQYFYWLGSSLKLIIFNWFNILKVLLYNGIRSPDLWMRLGVIMISHNDHQLPAL